MNKPGVKNTLELSPGQGLEAIPHGIDGFYVLAIEHGWVTPVSRAFSDNLEAFKQRLGKHLLILLSGESQVEAAREKFRSKTKYEPTLVITERHPAIWDPRKDPKEGLKIALGVLSAPEDVAMYLNFLTSTLNSPSFLATARWDARRRLLKKYLKAVPVVDLLTSFSGFFV